MKYTYSLIAALVLVSVGFSPAQAKKMDAATKAMKQECQVKWDADRTANPGKPKVSHKVFMKTCMATPAPVSARRR